MTTMVTATCFFLLGLALGLLHFAWLRRDVWSYVTKSARRSAVLSHGARLAVTLLCWIAVARFGGPAGLLGAFLGFLIARPLVTARTREAM